MFHVHSRFGCSQIWICIFCCNLLNWINRSTSIFCCSLIDYFIVCVYVCACMCLYSCSCLFVTMYLHRSRRRFGNVICMSPLLYAKIWTCDFARYQNEHRRSLYDDDSCIRLLFYSLLLLLCICFFLRYVRLWARARSLVIDIHCMFGIYLYLLVFFLRASSIWLAVSLSAHEYTIFICGLLCVEPRIVNVTKWNWEQLTAPRLRHINYTFLIHSFPSNVWRLFKFFFLLFFLFF